MLRIHLDFETYSELDLKKYGLGRYVTDSTTEVLCASYAIGNGPVQNWRPDRDSWVMPADLYLAIISGNTFVAHNAQFELQIWHHIMHLRHGWPPLDLYQTECTMAMAYAMSLPGSLEGAGAAVGLPVQKDKAGHALMMKMCKPYKYINGKPLWLWQVPAFRFQGETISGAEALNRLCLYCDRDVDVERMLDGRLMRLSTSELALWRLDQKINARGIGFDMDAVAGGLAVRDKVIADTDAQMAELTEGAVLGTTKLPALKAWLADHGLLVDSLAKDKIPDILDCKSTPEVCRLALALRILGAVATSVKKLDVISNYEVGGRVQFAFQYHGAGNGRWAGRGLQPHNLVRKLPMPAAVEELMDTLKRHPEMMDLLYDAPLATVSQCTRGFIVPAPGNRLMGGDWSSVEGRGIAWLAGEDWKLDAFREQDADPTLPDMYELTYAKTFGIDPRAVTDEQRQVGKVEELAFGFEGNVGAFRSMNEKLADELGDVAIKKLNDGWRRAHPAICGDQDEPRHERGGLWRDLEAAAMSAVVYPGKTFCAGAQHRQVKFKVSGSFLWMLLPTGRALCYPYPKVMWLKFGEAVTYKTRPSADDWKQGRVIEEEGQSRSWARVSTYGGKLAENADQAICRDILKGALLACNDAELPVIKHVHDEVIVEGPFTELHREQFHSIMNAQPKWAAGFPIKADCWLADRYQK